MFAVACEVLIDYEDADTWIALDALGEVVGVLDEEEDVHVTHRQSPFELLNMLRVVELRSVAEETDGDCVEGRGSVVLIRGD